MHRTILVGSPRPDGRSAHLADEIFDACVDECPQDGLSMVSVSGLEVGPCVGCDRCRNALPKDAAGYPTIPEKDDLLRQNPLVFRSDATAHQCFMEDGMAEVRRHLDAADHLIVVSPLYFAGPPAQLKALLDRLQPYFWSDIRSRTDRRRTFEVHVVGESGNPYGFDPLIGTLRSALGICGFKLTHVFDWVGRITAAGEILADAEEYAFDGKASHD